LAHEARTNDLNNANDYHIWLEAHERPRVITTNHAWLEPF
jgi:hypothetical protein